MNPHSLLLEASLRYDGTDDPDRRQAASTALRALLAGPDGAGLRRDVHVVTALGDVDALERLLRDDAAAARRPDGPAGRTALLTLCYSRVDGVPEAATLACLDHLLAAGADPNDVTVYEGGYRFTALTGALGEGEAGPRRQPPHPAGWAIAARLLAAGASPADAQALYNTMFTPTGDRVLALLLAHGLGPDAPVNGPDQPTPTLFRYLLSHALRLGHRARAALLVASGAHLDERLNGELAWAEAVVTGARSVADDIAARGGPTRPLTAPETLLAAVRSGDEAEARRLLTVDPALGLHLHFHAPLAAAAAAGDVAAVRVLLALGVPPDQGHPLHAAAWSGHVDVLDVLLAAGADRTRIEPRFHATAEGWARYAGQDAAVERLTR